MADSAPKAPISLDDFNYWVADMDDAIERFKSQLPDDVHQKLDFTPESLDIIEAFLLQRYGSFEEARSSGDSRIFDGAARYIGETLRKNLGGHWTINLDHPKEAFYGRPALRGFTGEASPLAPLNLATAATSRRTGTYLRTVLQNIRDRAGNQH